MHAAELPCPQCTRSFGCISSCSRTGASTGASRPTAAVSFDKCFRLGQDPAQAHPRWQETPQLRGLYQVFQPPRQPHSTQAGPHWQEARKTSGGMARVAHPAPVAGDGYDQGFSRWSRTTGCATGVWGAGVGVAGASVLKANSSRPEAASLWPPDANNGLTRKVSDAGERLKAGGEGMIEDMMVGWQH